jgi:hypothetical protein
MLARRSTAEIAVRHQDAGILESVPIEDEFRFRRAGIIES